MESERTNGGQFMKAAQPRTFLFDLILLVVCFLIDFALVLYTGVKLWSRVDPSLGKSMLFLLPSLVPGGLFIFFGIRPLIRTWQGTWR
jgi:hypothetical protein